MTGFNGNLKVITFKSIAFKLYYTSNHNIGSDISIKSLKRKT